MLTYCQAIREKALLQHAIRSENGNKGEDPPAARIREKEIAVSPDLWDSNPWLMTCQNGDQPENRKAAAVR